MTRTEKYKELRERIKREIAENELEYDFKCISEDDLKRLSRQKKEVMKDVS